MVALLSGNTGNFVGKTVKRKIQEKHTFPGIPKNGPQVSDTNCDVKKDKQISIGVRCEKKWQPPKRSAKKVKSSQGNTMFLRY